MEDTEVTKKHGVDAISVWENIWRECECGKKVGERESESDEKGVGKIH